jgi:hypothetical protein
VHVLISQCSIILLVVVYALLESLGNLERLGVNTIHGARQPKVSQLDRAVLVDETVGRLEVSVDDVRRVDILQAAQQVIHHG